MIVAAMGVAGSLALSRWRPGWAQLLGAGGLVLLGAGVVIGALPLVLAAAIWREAPADEGPAFSWKVPIATLGFAFVSIGLLTVGQFVRIGGVAVGMATVTVLAGMARARRWRHRGGLGDAGDCQVQ